MVRNTTTSQVKLHLKLGTDPPDVVGASECAMRMIELVGDGDGGDGSCTEVRAGRVWGVRFWVRGVGFYVLGLGIGVQVLG